MDDLLDHRYLSPEILGQGGMAVVYRALDPRLDRQVAVKVLHGSDDNPQFGHRFKNEARITGTLEHPSIPPVYEYGETSEAKPYFCLKLLEGDTLAQVIERLRNGALDTHQSYPFSLRLRIALRLVEALQYAHSRDLLHRDIKPENIMLGSYGEVWLVDWGLAGPPSEDTPREGERLTEEPTFMGTLEYAAPEQLAGVYTPATDQYSLGAVLYEFFCLKPAHPGESRYEIMTNVVQSVPPDAENFSSKEQGRVPREVSRVLRKMLAKNPAERYQGMKEVAQELATIIEGDIPAVCPHTLAKKSMHRLGRILDNHNYWLMPLLMLWLLSPFLMLAFYLLYLS